MPKPDPDDRFQRVHIAADHKTVLEHTTTDLSDTDGVSLLLDQPGVVAVSIRYGSGDTLSYSKRTTS